MEEAERIIYVCSNHKLPSKNIMDLSLINGDKGEFEGTNPFFPTRVIPVDLSPHSLRCELVILLERLDLKSIPEPTRHLTEKASWLTKDIYFPRYSKGGDVRGGHKHFIASRYPRMRGNSNRFANRDYEQRPPGPPAFYGRRRAPHPYDFVPPPRFEEFDSRPHREFDRRPHRQFDPLPHREFDPLPHREFDPLPHREFDPLPHREFDPYPVLSDNDMYWYQFKKDVREGPNYNNEYRGRLDDGTRQFPEFQRDVEDANESSYPSRGQVSKRLAMANAMLEQGLRLASEVMAEEDYPREEYPRHGPPPPASYPRRGAIGGMRSAAIAGSAWNEGLERDPIVPSRSWDDDSVRGPMRTGRSWDEEFDQAEPWKSTWEGDKFEIVRPGRGNRGFGPSARGRGLEPASRGRNLGPSARGRGLGSSAGGQGLGPSARGRGFGPTTGSRGYEASAGNRGFGTSVGSRGFGGQAGYQDFRGSMRGVRGNRAGKGLGGVWRH